MRGELRLLPHNPGSPSLAAVEEVALCDGSAVPRWIRIAGMRPHKNFLLVWFEGVDTAEKADALIGRSVAVWRDQLPQLEEGELYHCDLVGCRVETDAGRQLGAVEEILPTGSNDVLIARDGTREYLIPLIDEVVVEIDAVGKRIVITPMPGLLDP